MLFFRLSSIFITLLAGYLGYIYSKSVVAGLLLVTVLSVIFPVFLADSSFLVFSVAVTILLYSILIMILKKRG